MKNGIRKSHQLWNCGLINGMRMKHFGTGTVIPHRVVLLMRRGKIDVVWFYFDGVILRLYIREYPPRYQGRGVGRCWWWFRRGTICFLIYFIDALFLTFVLLSLSLSLSISCFRVFSHFYPLLVIGVKSRLVPSSFLFFFFFFVNFSFVGICLGRCGTCAPCAICCSSCAFLCWWLV